MRFLADARTGMLNTYYCDLYRVSDLDSERPRGGTYFNFGGFWEGGEELLAQSFGRNYPRVREVKANYDPENVFYYNLRILVGR